MHKRATQSPAQISVGQLKNRLSECLRAVEAGSRVTVVSHRRPVACIVPATEGPTVGVRKASRPWGSTQVSRTGRGRTDSTALLREERRRDRR
jgi:prevent-host-death family protein